LESFFFLSVQGVEFKGDGRLTVWLIVATVASDRT